MKPLLFILIILSGSPVFGQPNPSKFRINGHVQGFPNGTILYLHDLTDGTYVKIDSTLVTDNKFTFSGTIKTKFLRYSITTVDFNDRMSFWLEKGLTTFSATKGNFTKAIIKGSKIQDDQNKFNILIDTAKNRMESEYLFVKNNPTSIVSAYILSVYYSTWEKDKVKALYNSFSKEVKSTHFAKMISDYIRLNRNINVGDKFVDFTQKDSSNKNVRLSDFKGKVILLEFWGSWCGPCREKNPELVKIYHDFKQKGFEIFGVANETDKQKWIKAIKTDGLTWTNVTDLKGNSNTAAMIYGVSGYPTNYLIDQTGTIIAKEVYGDELRNLLLKIL